MSRAPLGVVVVQQQSLHGVALGGFSGSEWTVKTLVVWQQAAFVAAAAPHPMRLTFGDRQLTEVDWIFDPLYYVAGGVADLFPGVHDATPTRRASSHFSRSLTR
jgi:hypothetical protein